MRDSVQVCASERSSWVGEYLFSGNDEMRVTFKTLSHYVNYCRYAGVFFLFYILLSLDSTPCYRKPLNSWSFHGRGQKSSGGQALSPMNKRGNRVGVRCKFITRVCRAFVRVRLFVKSNQILSSVHSRRFYKSSIAEAGRRCRPYALFFYRQYLFDIIDCKN